jgi:hypothetical protein
MRKIIFFLLLLMSQLTKAQVYDDFLDGDFKFNPTWKSSNNDLDFIVVNNRLRSNSVQASSNFVISTPNELAINCKWEFWVNLQFNTSSANYVDIYLISDQEDLKSNLINGYFVRIGGTNDEISLFKRSGLNSSSLKIIDGVNGVTNSNNNSLKVRVTRDNEGLFTLERELIKSNSFYFTEGTVSDLDFTSSSYFGIFIQQSTASFFQKHFFDDFNVKKIITDTIAPELINVVVINADLLEINFNEAMDSLELKNTANLSISNYSGQIESVETQSDPKKFLIKLNTALNTGHYTLQISHVKDLNGNFIQGNNSASFYYKKPYQVKFGDIIINEIFADPSPQIDLPSVEFLELLNTTEEIISLNNWKIIDSSTAGTLINYDILPGSYLILSARSDTAEFKKFGHVLGLTAWPTLNNSGEKIILRDPSNQIIDSVIYSDSWHREASKKQGGWTLERISPSSICQGILNWESSKDQSGGTPGRQNSVYIPNFDQIPLAADSLKRLSDTSLIVYFNKPLNSSSLIKDHFSLTPLAQLKELRSNWNLKQLTLIFNEKFKPGTSYQLKITNVQDCSGTHISNALDISFKTPEAPLPPPPPPARIDNGHLIITEIFADPSPEVALPLIEFIELYNPGLDTVDLEGWSINDPQTKGIMKKYLLPPHQYLIICPLADTLQYKSYGRTLGISPWPSLNNSRDQITLKSFKNRIVDSVAYQDTWYKDSKKKPGGWTLEKIDLSKNSCNDFYNWAASIDSSGGTPGKKNSIDNPYYFKTMLKIDSIKILSENSIEVFFNQIPDTSYLKASSFSIKNKTEKANLIQIDASFKKIKLSFLDKFKEGITYFLSPDSLFSCAGDTVNTQNINNSFVIPEVPEIEYPIIINEIFADPSPVIELPEAEFIELFNPTDQIITLTGLSIGNSPPFTYGEMMPKDYLILCAEKDSLSFKPYGKVMALSKWTSLNNLKDSIQLKNNKGRVIQQVNYTANWHHDTEKRKGGYSLELINHQSFCPDLQNWTSSIDSTGGTPGRKNSVLSQNPTSEALKLVEVEVLDSISLFIHFNRSINSLEASKQTNYSINNGVGNAELALAQSPNFDKVLLKFNQPLTRGYTYRLSAYNISDCSNETLNLDFNSGGFYIAPKIEQNDVLISEILFNPRVGGVDFVEIYNNAKYPIDLKELTIARISNASINSHRQINQKQYLIEPGKYLALSINPENIGQNYSIKNEKDIFKMTNMPAFNNDEGTAVLLSGGKIIDQLYYTEKMHFPLLKNTKGISLERSRLNKPANEGGNLRSATMASGGATPGYQNSQYLDNIKTEDDFMVLSKTFSPDNDGFEDLLEINYRSAIPGEIASIKIFNDRGVLVKNLIQNFTLNTEGTFVWDGLNNHNQMSPLGIYLLHAEIFNLDGKIKRYKKSFALVSKFK